MNAISVVLVIVAITAATYFVFRMQEQIRILKNRNQLYVEFMRRTSVKKFLDILSKMDSKVINQDITLMFEKYFDLVLFRLEYEAVPNLLEDINQSPYSGILRKALVRAVTNGDEDVFGLALAGSINNPQEKLNIEFFLTHLPQPKRMKHYYIALSELEKEYFNNIIDLPSEYRKPTEEAMKSLKEKITQLS